MKTIKAIAEYTWLIFAISVTFILLIGLIYPDVLRFFRQ